MAYVNLNGTNPYMTLPNSITSNLSDFTVATWVCWNGGSNWQRVFDFGSGTTTYMFLSPKNGANGRLRFAITTSGGGGEKIIDSNAAFPVGGWHHVAVPAPPAHFTSMGSRSDKALTSRWPPRTSV